jgi:hypothetical protein
MSVSTLVAALPRWVLRGQICFSLLAFSGWVSAALWTSAQAACRDPDVARGFGSVAYAAEADATIQYFGHNFFLITTRSGTRIVTDPLGPGWYPTPNVFGHVVTSAGSISTTTMSNSSRATR